MIESSESRELAGDRELWDQRSQLDDLAAVLDPADQHGRKNAHIHHIHSWALGRFVRLRGHEEVLDFGCGTGRLTGLLCRRAAHVTGVDVSQGMVDAARRGGRYHNSSFQVYDGRTLPFDDQTFDALVTVVTMQVFCGEPGRFQSLLEEIVRTLRPTARVWMLERVVPDGVEKSDEWSRSKWIGALAEGGIRVESMRPVRAGSFTRIGRSALNEWFPDALLRPAAVLDSTLSSLRGVQPPYTECVFEGRLSSDPSRLPTRGALPEPMKGAKLRASRIG
jgi:SAM-dependent methyltransferase